MHPIVSAWLERTKSHWSKSYHERPDLEYLWVNKLFRKLVEPDADGDPRAQSIWAKVPKISCEHGKKGPMRFWPFVGFIMFYSISKLSLSTHFHSFSRQGFHKLESKTKIHVGKNSLVVSSVPKLFATNSRFLFRPRGFIPR